MNTFLFKKLMLSICCTALILPLSISLAGSPGGTRKTENFDKGWKFNLGDVTDAQASGFDDSLWEVLDLPHDWSIEGKFSKDNPATPSGGALPGGIGWYRKTFTIPVSEKGRLAFIDFDGVYKNSEVWINGHSLDCVRTDTVLSDMS